VQAMPAPAGQFGPGGVGPASPGGVSGISAAPPRGRVSPARPEAVGTDGRTVAATQAGAGALSHGGPRVQQGTGPARLSTPSTPSPLDGVGGGGTNEVGSDRVEFDVTPEMYRRKRAAQRQEDTLTARPPRPGAPSQYIDGSTGGSSGGMTLTPAEEEAELERAVEAAINAAANTGQPATDPTAPAATTGTSSPLVAAPAEHTAPLTPATPQLATLTVPAAPLHATPRKRGSVEGSAEALSVSGVGRISGSPPLPPTTEREAGGAPIAQRQRSTVTAAMMPAGLQQQRTHRGVRAAPGDSSAAPVRHHVVGAPATPVMHALSPPTAGQPGSSNNGDAMASGGGGGGEASAVPHPSVAPVPPFPAGRMPSHLLPPSATTSMPMGLTAASLPPARHQIGVASPAQPPTTPLGAALPHQATLLQPSPLPSPPSLSPYPPALPPPAAFAPSSAPVPSPPSGTTASSVGSAAMTPTPLMPLPAATLATASPAVPVPPPQPPTAPFHPPLPLARRPAPLTAPAMPLALVFAQPSLATGTVPLPPSLPQRDLPQPQQPGCTAAAAPGGGVGMPVDQQAAKRARIEEAPTGGPLPPLPAAARAPPSFSPAGAAPSMLAAWMSHWPTAPMQLQFGTGTGGAPSVVAARQAGTPFAPATPATGAPFSAALPLSPIAQSLPAPARGALPLVVGPPQVGVMAGQGLHAQPHAPQQPMQLPLQPAPVPPQAVGAGPLAAVPTSTTTPPSLPGPLPVMTSGLPATLAASAAVPPPSAVPSVGVPTAGVMPVSGLKVQSGAAAAAGGAATAHGDALMAVLASVELPVSLRKDWARFTPQTQDIIRRFFSGQRLSPVPPPRLRCANCPHVVCRPGLSDPESRPCLLSFQTYGVWPYTALPPGVGAADTQVVPLYEETITDERGSIIRTSASLEICLSTRKWRRRSTRHILGPRTSG